MLLKISLVIVVLPIIQAASFLKDVDPDQEAKARLYEDLANHTTVKNKLSPKPKNGTVDIDVALWIYKITEVSEAQQTIEICLLSLMFWEDEDLAWNPKSYSNLSMVSIPAASLWSPFLGVTNSADVDSFQINTVLDVKIYSNGTHELNAQAFTKTHCNIDLTFYPLDTQTCNVLLALQGGDILARPRHLKFFDPLDDDALSLFELNGEWREQDRSLRIFRVKDFQDFYFIEIQITIKRATLFYIFCVLLPLIVTSLLTLLVFWIPPGSGEKMSFLVSIYVSTALFINILGSTLPRNVSTSENTPRMIVCLVFVIMECIMAMIATVFVMRRHQQNCKDSLNLKDDDVIDIDLAFPEKQQTDGENALFDTKKGKIDNTDVAKSGKSFTKIGLGPDKRSTKVEPLHGMEVKCKKTRVTPEVLDRIFFLLFLFICVPFYSLVFTV